ncbi:MAG TPA: aminotransferase class I/II-fold pyridoxal phosphate-dependent enzyme [Dehalococcoidia bacterium]|nr:aminotransferase class I/II-fold pyridoxal phosphate-dependent enzyme [Dehalococcoidia bacterium]
MPDPSSLGFSTRAVRGFEADTRPGLRSTVEPIYQSSSFYYEDPEHLDAALGGDPSAYTYSRYGNPTVAAWERTLAALEGAEAAIAFGSGMAAIQAVFILLAVEADRPVLASREVYGATHGLLTGILRAAGVRTELIDFTDLEEVRRIARTLRPGVIYWEAMSNPLLTVVDPVALAEIAREVGALAVVDATFVTPYLQRPLDLGADLVVHSATKYLAGHGDVTGGIVAGRADLMTELRRVARLTGGILAPFEAWLTARGVQTLALRMERHCANAAEVAAALRAHPAVERIYYPGLPDHPSHAIARRYLPAGCLGGLVSFDLRDGAPVRIRQVLRRLEVVRPAATLGDTGSRVLSPPMASHRFLTPEDRAAIGIGEGLLRVSVGIEDAADIIADLEQAIGIE